MSTTYKRALEFLRNLGINEVPHTQKNYLAHLVAVYNFMKASQFEENVCLAGLLHSIYGTERFQGFKLSADRRPELAALIGGRAERLAYWNCMMDRWSLDRLLTQPDGPYRLQNRETGEEMLLDRDEYDDLCRVHLVDWLEQVPRSQYGWGYRREAYRAMADRLGANMRQIYDEVFAKESSAEQAAAAATSK